tara:strand:- start:113 stop:1099 length:987 start_codon:yes stop_codon:yes gene_type:complete
MSIGSVGNISNILVLYKIIDEKQMLLNGNRRGLPATSAIDTIKTNITNALNKPEKNFKIIMPLWSDDSFHILARKVNESLVLQLTKGPVLDDLRVPDNVIIDTKILVHHKHFMKKYNAFFNEVARFPIGKKIKRLPIAMLLFNEYEGHDSQKTLHIVYGYTYKGSRQIGLSTLLRKLIQVYAYEKNMFAITTEAITWGSQLASRRAGFHQAPLKRPRKVAWWTIPNELKTHLNYNQSTSTTKRRRIQNRWDKIAQASHIKKNVSGEPTNRNMQQMKNFYGGKVPLSIYGYGNRLHYVNSKAMKLPTSGTHVRRITKGKVNNIISNLQR